MIQVLDEMDSDYRPVMKRGQSEAGRANEVSHRYGPATMNSLQRYCRNEIEFWCRCKRAAILYDWIEGTPVEVIEKRFSTTPFQGAIGSVRQLGAEIPKMLHLHPCRPLPTAAKQILSHYGNISPRTSKPNLRTARTYPGCDAVEYDFAPSTRRLIGLLLARTAKR